MNQISQSNKDKDKEAIMKWPLWVKRILIENCNHIGVHVRRLNTLDHIPLRDGHHTSFMVMKCSRCGEMVGFPSKNMELALKEGTPEAKDQLRVLSERVLALP